MYIMKVLKFIFFAILPVISFSQQLPVNCDLAIPGCSTPGFQVVGTNPPYNTIDFGSGSVSNPSTNPQGVNSGCLLSGETVSTFITITAVTSGTLEWSLIGINPATGNPTNSGCFDWIMWPAGTAGSNVDACAGIHNNTLAPVSCNWNGSCNGNTGMSSPGNYPPNASSSSYQPPINVNAGDQFILCLSNYSYTNQTVNLDFFGSANVSCQPSTPDQTICLGSSATVNVLTFGLTNPTYNWLVTNGVSNPTSGENVIVTPTTTTEYVVEITSDEGVFLDTFIITVVPPPTPNAGADAIFCLGQETISLDGTAAAGNTTAWTVNTTGITPTPTVTYQPNAAAIDPNVIVNQPGVYTFTLTETSSVCPPATDQVQITVSRTTHTTSWVGPSCAGMSNGTITITNPDAVEYSYDGGLTWVTNNTNGGYGVGTYQVFSRNQHGCYHSSNVTITEPDQLLIYSSNDTLICQNGMANLQASTSAPGLPVTYHWSHSTNNNATVTVGPYTSNQTVSVYAEGPGGCLSDTAEIQITVRPVLSATISPYDTICPGYPTTIGVTGVTGGLANYLITWDTGESGNGTSMSISANPAQTQLYTATITDVCETTPLVLTTEVFVAPLPVPLMSVVEPVICEPAVFEVHNETDSTMTAGYVWYFPKSQSAINEPVIFTDTLMQGQYDVQLIVTSPLGCIDSITRVNFLTVQSKPKADFTWSPNPVLMFNTDVHFQNRSFLDHTYEWSFPGGIPSYSTLERPKVKYPEGELGTYPVTLIVTSELGCTDTLQLPLTVFPEVVLYAPNSFTPDGDEFNQGWKVYINGTDIQTFHMQIFNRWGEMIFENHDATVAWDGTYNGKIVETGTYVWKISARDYHNDGKYEWNGVVNILK